MKKVDYTSLDHITKTVEKALADTGYFYHADPMASHEQFARAVVEALIVETLGWTVGSEQVGWMGKTNGETHFSKDIGEPDELLFPVYRIKILEGEEGGPPSD